MRIACERKKACTRKMTITQWRQSTGGGMSRSDHASSPNDKSFLSDFFGFFFTDLELLSLTISPNEAKSSSCSCKSTTAFRFFLAADSAVLELVDEKFRLFEFVAFGFVVLGTGSTSGLFEGSGRGGRPCATYASGSTITGLCQSQTEGHTLPFLVLHLSLRQMLPFL